MSDPDDRRANRSLRSNTTVVVPPLHLGHGAMESGGMGHGAMRSGGMGHGGNNQTTSSSAQRAIRQPQAADDPFSMVIPETHLPEGWNALLQNPILANYQIGQEQALAVLQEQQRLRYIAMA